MEKGLQETWNRHDEQVFARFFAGDADGVNVVGWWSKGRPQIEKKVADAHVFMFRDSNPTNNEIRISFLSSRMAVVHVGWSILGVVAIFKSCAAKRRILPLGPCKKCLLKDPIPTSTNCVLSFLKFCAPGT